MHDILQLLETFSVILKCNLFSSIDFTQIEGDATTDLFSLNFPGKYPENVTFTWYVSAPEGYNILIHFKSKSEHSKENTEYLK